jgi:hypothetical protein
MVRPDRSACRKNPSTLNLRQIAPGASCKDGAFDQARPIDRLAIGATWWITARFIEWGYRPSMIFGDILDIVQCRNQTFQR